MRRQVHDLVDRAAETFPNRIAVICGDQQLTHRELRLASDGFARRLTEEGVSPGSRVALMMEPSAALVVAILGVLKAGAAYVPLDPTYPEARRRRMVELVGARRIVCSEHTRSHAAPLGLDVSIIAALSFEASDVRARRDGQFAYAMFTSGTTGTPKGILTTHENLAHFLESMVARLKPSPRSTYLFRTSPSFDPHTVEVFLPIIAGGKLVIPSPQPSFSARALAEIVATFEVDLVQATPSIWRALLRAGFSPQRPLTALCGGEALTESLKEALLSRPNLELWNVYGPTETTVWCAALRMRPGHPVRIGNPNPDVGLHVLRDDGSEAGEGERGELYIDGPGLAPGYVNAPELTQEAFLRHPFSAEPGRRIYRTGDMVRQCGDGTYEFLGRRDSQVKVRGHRVELAEVELAIEQTGLVSEGRVLAEGDERLVAFVVGRANALNEPEFATELRRALRLTLPEPMIPSVVLRLESLPLTPNMKVDVEALRSLRRARKAAIEAGDAPNRVTARVQAMWREILGAAEIQDTTSFFELGGHSLDVVHLQVRILEELDVELTVPEVYEHPRLGALCALIATRRNEEGMPSQPLATEVWPADLPLAPSQLCLYEETSAESIAANNLEFLAATSADPELVLAAIRALLTRHDVFFIDHVSHAGQRFSTGPVRWPTFSNATTRAGLETEVDAIRSATGLGKDYLYGFWVASIGGETHIYFIGSHLLFDGTSLEVIKDELDVLLRNPEARLPACASFRTWLEAPRPTTPEINTFWADQVQRAGIRDVVMPRAETGGGLGFLNARVPFGGLAQPSLIGACVSAFADTFSLSSVPCRLVHSGRNVDPNRADALTVGWLSHHFPLWIDAGKSPKGAAASAASALSAVPGSGESYGWLRYRSQAPELLCGLSLWDFPLYINVMPVRSTRRDLADVGLPPMAEARTAMIGLAVVISDAKTAQTLTVCFDRSNMPRPTAARFLSELSQRLEKLE